MRFTNAIVLATMTSTTTLHGVDGFAGRGGYLESLTIAPDAPRSTTVAVDTSSDVLASATETTTSGVAADDVLPDAVDVLLNRDDAVRRGIEMTRDSFGFRNDGKYWFMKTGLGGYQPSTTDDDDDGGGVAKVKRVVYGAPVDVDAVEVSPERAEELRRAAAEELVNIDDAERRRRVALGNVVLAATAVVATLATFAWSPRDDVWSHALRFATVFPLYSAGYGLRRSGVVGM